MSFKAWARANIPKAYTPVKQPLKSTEPMLSIETTSTAEFQPGDHIHYVNSLEQIRYGRFVRYDGTNAYAYFGNTPQESEQNPLETHTRRINVRPGWPNYPRNHDVAPVTLADEFDEWDEF